MAAVGQEAPATVQSRLGKVMVGVGLSTYGPTGTHKKQLAYAEQEYAVARERLNKLTGETIPAFEAALLAAGGPWTTGGAIPE